MPRLIFLAYTAALVSAGDNMASDVFDAQSTNFEEEVKQVVSLLQMTPGMTYCEMGGGDGQFMVAIGKTVMPGGKVRVTEAFNNSLLAIKNAAHNAGIEISTVLANETTMGLPAEGCDVIMSRMVYHMIDETVALETYLPQLKQALKPGGQMLIIDHDPDNGATTRDNATITWTMPNMQHEMHHMAHKMPVVPRLQEIVEFTSAGFALTKTLEWPWLGEAGHGYALLWKHGMSSSQKSQPTLESNVESQPIQVRRQTSKQGRKVSQSVDSTGKIADSTGKIARHES